MRNMCAAALAALLLAGCAAHAQAPTPDVRHNGMDLPATSVHESEAAQRPTCKEGSYPDGSRSVELQQDGQVLAIAVLDPKGGLLSSMNLRLLADNCTIKGWKLPPQRVRRS